MPGRVEAARHAPTGTFELLLGRTSVEIPLPPGLGEGPPPQVILCNGRLQVQAGADLAVEGHASIAFARFPFLETLLPDEARPLKAAVRFDEAGGLTVDVEPGTKLELGIDLPTLDAGNRQIPLGRIRGGIGGVGFRLSNSQEPALDVVLLLTLPEGLNRILGGHAIFETTKPVCATLRLGVADRKPVASVSLGDALAMAPSQVTSPFKAIAQSFTWDGTDVSGRLDLGSAGAIQIRVPQLAYGAGAFVAHGGFALDPDKPLGLPLWPLKSALGNLIGAAVDGLPDYLPLQDMSVLDARDRFNVGKLVQALNSVIPNGAAPASWLHEAIAELKRVLDSAVAQSDDFAKHLPERLKEYLRASPFHPGQRFDLDIAISPAGSVDVRIKCEPPLRLLVPTPSALVGLTLGEFSLGPILGGALLKLKVDACIDSFDLLSLALFLPAAMAGDKANPLAMWLPDLSRMQNTLVVRELLALVEYETAGIPIPIPLLAKDLGFKFVGIGGLELAGGVSCHLQRDDIGDIVETVGKLFRFITTDCLLTQDDGRGLQLLAGVDATYLQLPAIVGGQVIGSKAPLVPERDAVAYAFRLLNALKGFSLAELVRGIPLALRVQAFDQALGPARAHGGVAVTTVDEFLAGFGRADVGPHDQLYALSQDREAAERLLGPVRAAREPADGSAHRSGVVVLAAGACSFGPGLSLEAQTAAALIGASAFAAAFHLGGAVAGLSLDLNGCAHFDLRHLHDEGAIGVAGRAALKLGQHVVCEGAIAVSGAGIAIDGDLDIGTALVPGLADVLHVTGAFSAALSKAGFDLRLAATENARLGLLGVSGAAQQFALTSSGLAARLMEQLPNVGACELTLGIADFRNLESYSITGSVQGRFTAHATEQALGALENAYRTGLRDALASLDDEIGRTSYWHPVALAELEAERAVIEALELGRTWAEALATAISYVVGRYATLAQEAVTWATSDGLAIIVARRLKVFGRLAQWSPAQWKGCVTVTDLRLAATVGKREVEFDAYGYWSGSRANTPQKLVEIRADMPVLRPYAILDRLVADIVKFLLARL